MPKQEKTSFSLAVKRFVYKNLSILQIAGWLVLLLAWWLVTNFGLINGHILPTPTKTWNAFIDMKDNDSLWDNILFSVRINIYGYLKCIAAALVVGFAIGLSQQVRQMF